MTNEGSAQTIENNTKFEYKIEVGQHGEGMCCINCPSTLSEDTQSVINDMLLNNQGVGIIGGYFDEKLTICRISGFAVKTLGYEGFEDFLSETKAELLNMTVSDEEKRCLRSRLLNPKSEIFSYYLTGKDGKAVSVHMGNASVKAEDGREMWYISIRKLGELHHDSLTGGYNRQGFMNYITSLKNSGVDLKDYAIVCVNIKGFKVINDLYGSEYGDSVLISAYKHFNTCKIQPVICARKDADRFLLLLKRENLNLDILPEVLNIPYTYGDKKQYAKSICGIYYIDDTETKINTMIDCAKIAREKVSYAFIKPYVVFEPSMKSDYIRNVTVLSQFDDALSKSEFKIYYQPVIDCKTKQIVSAEALVRWETEDGVLSPARFIPAFEENGCIAKLDEYVLTNVIRYLRSRAENNLPIVPISVNLSRMDFFDNERTDRLYEIFRCDPFVCKFVHFEITETSYLSVKERQAEFIRNISCLGGKVYIDDFGMSNSSLDMLAQYDFGILKLDMQFIREMEKNSKARILVEGTIYIAHNLNMKVVAEGVETGEQFEMLRDMDCDYIQGYLFSKPLPQTEFGEYLITHFKT